MSAADGKRLSPADALAREFGLRRNPFLIDAAPPDELTEGVIVARLVDGILAALRGGSLLTVAGGENRRRCNEVIQRLSRMFNEKLRFFSLHGDKLDLAGSRDQSGPGAPARLHQSIDSIEFVVESAILQSTELERAGLLIDHADALDQGSLLALLDFVQRARTQNPPVQLVLVGGQDIVRQLTDASCARFGDLAAHWFDFDRLTLEEARALFKGRLEHAGADAKLFPVAAVDALHELSGGHTEIMLGLALWSLWLAGEHGVSAVAPAIAREAAEFAMPSAEARRDNAPASGESTFRPGKVAVFDRPRICAFDPSAISAVSERNALQSGHAGEPADTGKAAPAGHRRWRAAALIAAAAGVLAVLLLLGRVVRQTTPPRIAAPANPSVSHEAQPSEPEPEPELEELPAVSEAYVGEPAFLDIGSGEVHPTTGESPAAKPLAPAQDLSAPEAVGADARTVPAAEIDALLDAARTQLAERRLTTPPGNNARETFAAVLDLDPGNPAARTGLDEMTGTYLRWGETAERRDSWREAQLYYGRALELDPDSATATAALARVREQLAGTPSGAPERQQALLRAARSGDVIEIAAQLDAGTAPDARDTRGKTPLMWAVELGHLRTARQLEARGADVNAATPSGETPLMYAAQGGHEETVRFLIDNRAQVGSSNQLGWTALLYAAVGGRPAVVGELLEAGADADASSAEGRTPLMAAARNGNLDVVERLIDGGANVDAADASGWTPLMFAAWQGHTGVAQALIGAGADLDGRNAEGQTALTLGIVRHRQDVVDQLVQAGARR